MNYADFIAQKIPRAESFGFSPITPAHECLKPHQRDIAKWLVEGGRRACFIAFGGGKTRIHLQVARWIAEVHPGEKYLIVAPLGVRFEFTKEQGPAMGMEVVFCRTDAEVDATDSQIVITNYESVREGKITVNRERFCGLGLDEASVLRSFGSKTYQEFLTLGKGIKYRFVFTATPSPNRHKELIHYGGFLGVMDTGDCLTRFFGRNSEKAGDLQLYPHMEEPFWHWLSTWAVFMQRPSDLSYSDEGYDLPPGPTGPSSPNVHWHRIPVDHSKAWKQFDSWGQAQLLRDQSSGLPEQAEVKRETMIDRVCFAKELMDAERGYSAPIPKNAREEVIDAALHHVENQSVLQSLLNGRSWGEAFGIGGASTPFNWDADARGIHVRWTEEDQDTIKPAEILARANQFKPRHWILWHELEDERRLIEEMFPRAEYGSWFEYRDGHPVALELYNRHYSAHQYADGRERKLFCGPGEKCVLLNRRQDALFVWRKFVDDSGQQGINCAIFRNEGDDQSSDLIREAMAIAWLRWPGERLYTYVNAEKIESKNPGYCFKRAGWKQCGETKGGLIILEAAPGQDVLAVTKQLVTRTAYGSQDLDEREEIIIGFAHGQFPILGTKPSIAGSGTNLQRHCADAIFLGSTYKFNDFIQAVHRIYRFQQAREVHIHVIYSESEEPVVNALKQKWSQHNELVAKMTDLIRKHGLALNPLQLVRDLGVKREEVSGEFFRAILNDAIPEVASWPENCVSEIVTSIPFGNQYEYSPNYCDLGHNVDNEAFFRQMDFLVPNLLRILQPGRIAAIHVKDRIRFGNVTGRGTPTVDRFSDKTADLLERHGFWFMGRITIDTDVVRENNQTYRLGWSEVCKDGTKMGVGMPEYVLIFRKPPSDCSNSYADAPVTKDKETYGRSDWQVDASSFWKSSGVTLPDLQTLKQIPVTEAGRIWRKFAAANPYCHACHVQAAKALESKGTLPAKFMLFPAIARHPDIWTDVVRMRVLNAKLDQRNRENHICPLQIDVVERLINRYSNPGEVVFDPFAGVFTVPYVAVGMGRIGWGTELARNYWENGVEFCQEAERKRKAPEMDLFANFSASEPEMAVAK